MSPGYLKHHRRSLRLPEYDYSQEGAYYITICTQDRKCLLGKIANGRMALTRCGEIAEKWWNNLPEYFPDVVLNEYVIMPNHFHGIIIITGDGSRGLINQTPTDIGDKWILMKNPKPTLGKIIRHFKAQTAKYAHDSGCKEFCWQRNYWEHVIRNDKSYGRIRQYIIENPLYWGQDQESPERKTYKEMK
jgi:putative transposase